MDKTSTALVCLDSTEASIRIPTYLLRLHLQGPLQKRSTSIVSAPSNNNPKCVRLTRRKKPKSLQCRYHLPTCHGCPSDEHTPEESQYLHDRLYFIQTLGSTTVRSPRFFRTQLAARYVEDFFPAYGFQQFPLLAGLLRSRECPIPFGTGLNGPSITAATDALLLLQTGTLHYDRRLAAEGRVRYTRAVELLRAQLERPDAVHNDGVLGAVAVLSVCEMYGAGREDGWRKHMQGLMALLQTRGPKSVMARPFAVALTASFQQTAMLDALWTRKGNMFAEPQWREITNRGNRNQAGLREMAMEVPGLLERADKVLAARRKGGSEGDETAVMKALVRAEAGMVSWFTNWYRTEAQTSMVRTRKLDDTEASFFAPAQHHTSDSLPTAAVYPSLPCALVHIYYYICLLTLRLAIYTLATAIQSISHLLPCSVSWLHSRALETADSLYQSLPYFLRAHGTSLGGALSVGGPLNFALAAYETLGQKQKAEACWALRRRLEAGRLNVPRAGQGPLMFKLFSGVRSVSRGDGFEVVVF